MQQDLKRVYDKISDTSLLSELPYWAASVSVGILAVVYADLFSQAEEWSYRMLLLQPYALLVITPVLFSLSWYIVQKFAPEAKGSGIPQVMASIQRLETHHGEGYVDRLLGFKTLIVKVLSSLLCALGGGAIGREGPTVQIAASVFYFISTKFNMFPNNSRRVETWLITGGAAGIAAAFNTPLGGLVYGIEELASSHINRFKTSLISAVIIAGLASQWVSGPYLYLGFPKLLPISMSIVPWVILVSVICGLAGGLFGRSLLSLSRRTHYYLKQKHYVLVPIMCGLLVAGMALLTDGHSFGSGKKTILDLLFSKQEVDWYIPVVRFIAPVASYISGGAGGVFAPSLAAGGTMGYWIAEQIHTQHTNLFVLLGMIAFLTGVTRTPFTAFVLVLEMTDRHSAIFPMMLSALVAVQVARLVHPHSFYEILKETYQADVEQEIEKSQRGET